MISVGLAVAALVAYLAAVARSRSLTRAWPVARTACFAAGVAASAAVVSPQFDGVADRLLWTHMLQHSVLQLVAAPLLVLGMPTALALRALPPSLARMLAAGLRRVSATGATSLPGGLVALVGVLWAIHLTPLFVLAERHPLLHAGEHALLLGSAFAFWTAVLAADPLRRGAPAPLRAGCLALAMPLCDVVAIWLMSAADPRYPSIMGPDRAAAMADQRLAAVVMAAGSMVLAVASLTLAWRWLVQEPEPGRVGA